MFYVCLYTTKSKSKYNSPICKHYFKMIFDHLFFLYSTFLRQLTVHAFYRSNYNSVALVIRVMSMRVFDLTNQTLFVQLMTSRVHKVRLFQWIETYNTATWQIGLYLRVTCPTSTTHGVLTSGETFPTYIATRLLPQWLKHMTQNNRCESEFLILTGSVDLYGYKWTIIKYQKSWNWHNNSR